MCEREVFDEFEADALIYMPQVRDIMKHCLRGCFKSLLVLTPRCAGKSYFAAKGLWVDGSKLVSWPSAYVAGKLTKMEVAKLGVEHFLQIENYLLNKPGEVVAFTPNSVSLDIWLNTCREASYRIGIVLWMPCGTRFYSNVSTRGSAYVKDLCGVTKPYSEACGDLIADYYISVKLVKQLRPYSHDDMRGFFGALSPYLKEWYAVKYWTRVDSLIPSKGNQDKFPKRSNFVTREALMNHFMSKEENAGPNKWLLDYCDRKIAQMELDKCLGLKPDFTGIEEEIAALIKLNCSGRLPL